MEFDFTYGGSEEETVRRLLVQDIIDRILYVPEFKAKCEDLVKSNPLPEKIKIKHSPLEFKS